MAARRGKAQAKRNGGGGGGIPGWAWLLTGLIGGLVVALVVLNRDGLLDPAKLWPQPNPQASTPKEPEPPVAQQPAATADKKPKYDFYKVLTEGQVEIPDSELAEQAKAVAPQPTASPAGERLLLQAGAFGDPVRAEEIKAAIAFSGLVARIEPTQAANGQTVHRVMLGPFASTRELEAAKSSLAASGVQTFAIREPVR